MGLLQSGVVPKNSGKALILKKGQSLRADGRTVVDCVAFNLHTLRERFDQAGTKTNQAEIFKGQ